MLEPRDWKVSLEVYAREPILALLLAYQFNALKQSLKRGHKGIPEAITGINQAIEHLYPHTDFNKIGRRLFYKTIGSTITVKQEQVIAALKHSLLQSKRKPTLTPDNRKNRKPQISLVKATDKVKASKRERLRRTS